MHIHGIGIISSVGRGLEVHRAALKNGPALMDKNGCYRVAETDLKDPILVKEARRATRFDRMAVLAGMDALKDAGIPGLAAPSTWGLILATGLGPHVTTFRFLDDMIEFKEKDVSPTLFSHSVHNAAASYLSFLAGLRGPTLTVTRFLSAFPEALKLAGAWLERKRCDYVLVGAVDELGTVMEQVFRLRSPDADMAPGEGSVFFVVSNLPSLKKYGMITSESGAGAAASTEDLLGRQPCQRAFDCAAAALLLSHPTI